MPHSISMHSDSALMGRVHACTSRQHVQAARCKLPWLHLSAPRTRRRAVVAGAEVEGRLSHAPGSSGPPLRVSCPRTQLDNSSDVWGAEILIVKDRCLVGSSTAADLRVLGPNVVEEHALIEKKGGRVYCTALVGDPDDFLADTFTWVDGCPLRPGVSYVLSPDAKVAFGNEELDFSFDFEEQGGVNAVAAMAWQGFTRDSSEEVRKLLEQQS